MLLATAAGTVNVGESHSSDRMGADGEVVACERSFEYRSGVFSAGARENPHLIGANGTLALKSPVRMSTRVGLSG